jgi:hypothetical protein
MYELHILMGACMGCGGLQAYYPPHVYDYKYKCIHIHIDCEANAWMHFAGRVGSGGCKCIALHTYINTNIYTNVLIYIYI